MPKDIETMIGEIDKLDDQILELNQSIAAKLNALQGKKSIIRADLDNEISSQANNMLDNKPYKCGTANIETDRYKIKATVSKKVKWDEAVLRSIANKIRQAGQDPEVYIKYKLSVSETAYKGFSEDIQEEFLPAREVTPSAPKIEIVRK